jgi:hypothetical protein
MLAGGSGMTEFCERFAYCQQSFSLLFVSIVSCPCYLPLCELATVDKNAGRLRFGLLEAPGLPSFCADRIATPRNAVFQGVGRRDVRFALRYTTNTTNVWPIQICLV